MMAIINTPPTNNSADTTTMTMSMSRTRTDRMKRSFLLSAHLLLAASTSCLGKEDAPFLECDLYVAESTIPFAGLGIFTAVEKKVGDMVGNGDVCFPLLETDWHNGIMLDENKEYYNPFEDYVW
jgi:hypothetical protein